MSVKIIKNSAGADASTANSHATDDRLNRLKELILGEEKRQLHHIQKRLDEPALRADEVGRVLDRAVLINQKEAPEALAEALAPTVEASLYASVRNNPERLGEALFPVMAPAIRKSIVAIVSSMVESLNHMLEHSFSVKGLKWRIEAIQTGRPYAEILMLHTLEYRVEQIFLIHKDDGILLQHVSCAGAENQDADIVSSMLTAIQDFVRDSFQVESHDSIEKLSIGEMDVFVEAGSEMVLAAVVRGNAPAGFQEMLKKTCESIHLMMAGELHAFHGDTSPFGAVLPKLEACLISQSVEKTEQSSNAKAIVALASVAVLIAGWVFWNMYQSKREDSLIRALDAIPGITVIQAAHEHGKLHISGLRDPLSDNPQNILQAHDFSAEHVHLQWTPYQSLEPQLLLRRAKHVLAPTSETHLALADDKLIISGAAPRSWFKHATAMLPALPGISGYHTEQLVLRDSADYLLQLARQRLAPPQSIKLSIQKNNVLVAKGKAEHEWIVNAESAARQLPQISAYDDEAVIDLNSDAYLLSEAKRLLKPPSSVHLNIKQGMLFASGKAPSDWIDTARKRVANISGIARFDASRLINTGTDAYLLARMRELLQPPASVSLKVDSGVLTVDGIAGRAWVEKARKLALDSDELQGYVDRNLLVEEKELLRLRTRLRGITLHFESASNQLRRGEKSKLIALAAALKKQTSLMRMTHAKLHISANSGILSKRAGQLALNRARRVMAQLKDMGVAYGWMQTDVKKVVSYDKTVAFDLTWKPLP